MFLLLKLSPTVCLLRHHGTWHACPVHMHACCNLYDMCTIALQLPAVTESRHLIARSYMGFKTTSCVAWMLQRHSRVHI